jgi:uncharacterized RDD family membrane protein YckC
VTPAILTAARAVLRQGLRAREEGESMPMSGALFEDQGRTDEPSEWGSPTRGTRTGASSTGSADTTAPSWAASLTSTTPVPGPAGLLLAEVPNRVVALFIDGLVVAVLAFVAGLVIFGIFGSELLGVVLWLAASIGLSAGYFVYAWGAPRATLGMRLLNLRIGHETDGRPLGREQALVRWAVLGVPLVLAQSISGSSDALVGVLSIAGLVWLVALLYSVAASPTKQGYHDRLARTIVFKAPRHG